MNDFDGIHADAERELQILEQKEGERWKRRDAIELRHKLIEEFHIWNAASSQNGSEYLELLHMMNSIRRLAWKLKETEKD